MQPSDRTILLVAGFAFVGSWNQAFAARLVLVAGGGDKITPAPALESKFDGPFGVDFDRSGNMFIIEMTGNRLRKMDSRGIISTVAGNGDKGETGDGGPAVKAQFNGPHHLAVLPSGDVLVADTWSNRVRKIDASNGLITPIIGTGKKGYGGDGGPASEATFGGLYCAALNSKGANIYLADLDN